MDSNLQAALEESEVTAAREASRISHVLNKLKAARRTVVIQEADGNCLFRALASGGVAENHRTCRREVVHQIRTHGYGQTCLKESKDQRADRMARDKEFGELEEIISAAARYKRHIIVWSPFEDKPISIGDAACRDLEIVWDGNRHYDAVIVADNITASVQSDSDPITDWLSQEIPDSIRRPWHVFEHEMEELMDQDNGKAKIMLRDIQKDNSARTVFLRSCDEACQGDYKSFGGSRW
jgi:hypothetical protein